MNSSPVNPQFLCKYKVKIVQCFRTFAIFLDIDECTVDLGQPQCDPNARCINLAGSYDCRCNRGYKGNGFNCYRKYHSHLAYNGH